MGLLLVLPPEGCKDEGAEADKSVSTVLVSISSQSISASHDGSKGSAGISLSDSQLHLLKKEPGTK